MIARLKNLRNYTVLGIFLINILALFTMVFSHWPEWWRNINFEDSVLTWYSSVQLILIGIAGCTCFIWPHLTQKRKLSITELMFPIVGLGFIFLSLDERFQIHEKLREKVFIPNQIGTNISGVGEGDFTHILFAIVGLIFSYFLYKGLRESKLSLSLFAGAILLSLTTVIMDTTTPIPADPMALSAIELHEGRLHQFTEEILETIAQAFFLASFTSLSIFRLEALLSNVTKKTLEEINGKSEAI
ncbi:MAG: hypothetical protein KC478_06685 [Bacteriovoracaceae bacterium]|nr:hypothetical protein [Bacteriovoracaceae bacterium]